MIIIKTKEQLIEMAARLIYLLSNLRAYQKDFESSRAIAVLCKDDDITKWETRIDEFLSNIEAVEFKTCKELISELTQMLNNETTETGGGRDEVHP